MTERHRVLVVGTGSIGERHARCFLATGRAEVAICESLPERRSDVVARLGINQSYAGLDEAVLESGADVAVIATPAQTHIPIACRLADAGMHLLIEKPLSLSLDGVDRLQEVVSARELTAGVAYCWRFHPLLEQPHRFLEVASWGRPLEIVFQSGQDFPFYRPAYRDIYYNSRATGGGAIQDAITHALNSGEWFVGPIQRVGADAKHQRLEGVTVEDTVHVMTRQGINGDVMGSYSLNQYQAANESNWSVVMEGGVVRIEVGRMRWMSQDDPSADWTVTDVPDIDRDTMYIAQANGFLDAVEGKCEPRCTLADGLQTLKVNLAVLDAVDNNRSLQPIL